MDRARHSGREALARRAPPPFHRTLVLKTQLGVDRPARLGRVEFGPLHILVLEVFQRVIDERAGHALPAMGGVSQHHPDPGHLTGVIDGCCGSHDAAAGFDAEATLRRQRKKPGPVRLGLIPAGLAAEIEQVRQVGRFEESDFMGGHSVGGISIVRLRAHAARDPCKNAYGVQLGDPLLG